MVKIIICIILNKNNIDVIKETYLKTIESNTIEYYFIANNKLSHFNDELIYLNIENNVHFNVIKYFDSYNYDFILITYENSFVNIKNLINLLANYDSKDKLYIGGHGDYRIINNNKFWFHSYTPGIILSKKATKLLLDNNLMIDYNNLPNNNFRNLSGVAIGFYAKLFNMNIIINDNFYYCNWKGIPCHESKIKVKDLICCYNMSKDDMYNYYNTLFINNNFTGSNLIILPGGGLGNILFQYFLGYTLNKEYNCKIHYQINYNYWRGDINKYKMLQNLNFIDLNNINHDSFSDYNEKDFFYNPIDLDLTKNNNYKISGYYQSYKYSEKYINEIRDELFFNVASLYFQIEKYYNSLKNNKQTCLIHVRRGDYLMYYNVHPPLKDEYYKKAIKLIPNCKYFVFSDDNNYVSNWSVLKGLDYEIVNINDPEEILIFMSLCDNFIIANSTLSLVAYLLRKNKDAKLVGPKIWFGEAGYKYKIEDIIPPNGILIDI